MTFLAQNSNGQTYILNVGATMFERFTEKAIKVIMLSQEEARRLGHNFVGTEQILLGLVGEGTGIAARTLKGMGVSLLNVRAEVEKIIGRGSGFIAVEIPFTPRAKRLLEFAWDEARQLGHNYIGTEHLLLALVREGEGVAARVLGNLQVDLTKIRCDVIKRLGEVALKAKTDQAINNVVDAVAESMIDALGKAFPTISVNEKEHTIKLSKDSYAALLGAANFSGLTVEEVLVKLIEGLTKQE